MSPTLKKFGIAAGLLLTLGACLIGGNAVATGKDAAVAKEIQTKLQAEIPNARINEVNPTPIAGIYEVVVNGRNIMYVDKNVKYLIDGELIDMKQKLSLTQQRVQALSKVDFASLPLQDAIKIVRGNGSRQMAVFTDPDCPFCKRLEQEGLKDLDNITIYQFLMPLDQLHPDAARKSALVWCAPDRVAAWNELMLQGKEPAGDGKCDTPLARVAALAQKLGISGTPGIVFASGKLVPGAISREQIEKELAVAAK